MSLNIKNATVEQLARDLTQETGGSLTTAIAVALEERLLRVRGPGECVDFAAIAKFQAELAALPRVDERTERQISDELWGES